MQLDWFFNPLRPHVQVFTPSPLGYATPGAHWPSGQICGGAGPQFRRLQEASRFRPLLGQRQVLQLSPAE